MPKSPEGGYEKMRPEDMMTEEQERQSELRVRYLKDEQLALGAAIDDIKHEGTIKALELIQRSHLDEHPNLKDACSKHPDVILYEALLDAKRKVNERISDLHKE